MRMPGSEGKLEAGLGAGRLLAAAASVGGSIARLAGASGIGLGALEAPERLVLKLKEVTKPPSLLTPAASSGVASTLGVPGRTVKVTGGSSQAGAAAGSS
jgi:hypothetical protein